MGFFDTLLTAIAPERAVKRVAAQTAIRAINSGYSNYGASLHKKSMRGWMWHGGSPKEDIEDNLRVLRERSRDAYTYYIGAGNAKGASIVQENVTKAVEEFQQWQRSIGRDISPMELIYRLRVAGVKRVELRQPVYMVVEGGSDLEKATVQIPKLSGTPTIIYGGVEDD